MVAQLQDILRKAEQLPDEAQLGLAYRIAFDLGIDLDEKPVVVREGSELARMIARAKDEQRRGATIPVEDLLRECPD
jgi:hypothetical protein